MDLKRIEKLFSYYSPLPLCVINVQGKVKQANGRIADVFKYDGIVGGDIYALTGFKMPEILEVADTDGVLYLDRNDRSFRIVAGRIGDDDDAPVLLYFIDNTSFKTLKSLYNDDKLCIATINVDNFDELTASAGENREMEISTEIDKLIRDWAERHEAAIIRYREHIYEMLFTHKNYRKIIDSRFAILDDARKIESEADFPVTLSIGIGIGGKTPAECAAYAEDALDLALGRGGDQAVVKNVKNFEYYGGKSQSVEKGNKGKSRIIAHALKTLMIQCSKVFIMGHYNPDMDTFGSALGIHRVAESVNKEAYIVMNYYNDTLIDIMDAARETGNYEFISSEKAISMVDQNSLVVVIDTHRPQLVESIELIEAVNRTVVIDHHRKAEDFLPDVILMYMESYASSASELVTEIVQYACEKKELTRMEADALMAGIMVDTNRFAVKAGVRTFEAASWLRRAGADLEKVRTYFQSDAESLRIKSLCIANAQFFDGGIAMSICPGHSANSQIINSQVADDLLGIKGIKASFVAGQNQDGKTIVSARSLGEINVQMVMEKFGGGGHLNTAGGQVDVAPEEILEQIKEVLDKQFVEVE